MRSAPCSRPPRRGRQPAPPRRRGPPFKRGLKLLRRRQRAPHLRLPPLLPRLHLRPKATVVRLAQKKSWPPRASVCRAAARPGCRSSSPRCRPKMSLHPQATSPHHYRMCRRPRVPAICSRPRPRRMTSSIGLLVRSPAAKTRDDGASPLKIETKHLIQRRRRPRAICRCPTTPTLRLARNPPRRPSGRCRRARSARMPIRCRHRRQHLLPTKRCETAHQEPPPGRRSPPHAITPARPRCRLPRRRAWTLRKRHRSQPGQGHSHLRQRHRVAPRMCRHRCRCLAFRRAGKMAMRWVRCGHHIRPMPCGHHHRRRRRPPTRCQVVECRRGPLQVCRRRLPGCQRVCGLPRPLHRRQRLTRLHRNAGRNLRRQLPACAPARFRSGRW